MIYAIARCSSDSLLFQLPDTIPCVTLQQSCAIIETNDNLLPLKELLTSEIETYYYCPSCHQTSNTLITLNTSIFIFKLTKNNELIAYPTTSANSNISNDPEPACTSCKYSIKNIDLPVCKQIFHKCPRILLVSYEHIHIFMYIF